PASRQGRPDLAGAAEARQALRARLERKGGGRVEGGESGVARARRLADRADANRAAGIAAAAADAHQADERGREQEESSSRHGTTLARSEERRVGKECRCRWTPTPQTATGAADS